MSVARNEIFVALSIVGAFRREDGDDYEYEFSALSMRIRFRGRHFFEVRVLRKENSYS